MAKTYKELQFKVLIEQDEDGVYVASVPQTQLFKTEKPFYPWSLEELLEKRQLL